ncbi:MAG: hypothetical protein H6772_04470 [Pseudomonadales bacterium]|nr:hypothetical protein [Pseudomonadales bacterium]
MNAAANSEKLEQLLEFSIQEEIDKNLLEVRRLMNELNELPRTVANISKIFNKCLRIRKIFLQNKDNISFKNGEGESKFLFEPEDLPFILASCFNPTSPYEISTITIIIEGYFKQSTISNDLNPDVTFLLKNIQASLNKS